MLKKLFERTTKKKMTAISAAFAVAAVMGAGVASADEFVRAKKYEMVPSDVDGLYRVRALRDIGLSVKAGDLGGYVENESNLAQDGYAWVKDNARVFGDARVRGDARVYGHAWVFDSARVMGTAMRGYLAVRKCSTVRGSPVTR
jgi:hypothetical protein